MIALGFLISVRINYRICHPENNTTVMIPIHAKELGKGLERAILREANIKKP
ncbi:type II toxin-antitoxin system HicA family toxin [Levilactobacillus zymae]|uniref:type II toxin-antitoxin system HicA family toxin n=1 Tax=Levilactobacillus zymae TaxID=267363 RepID=UPI003FCE380C